MRGLKFDPNICGQTVYILEGGRNSKLLVDVIFGSSLFALPRVIAVPSRASPGHKSRLRLGYNTNCEFWRKPFRLLRSARPSLLFAQVAIVSITKPLPQRRIHPSRCHSLHHPRHTRPSVRQRLPLLRSPFKRGFL